MLIDATQFVNGSDMCAKISLACAQLGTTNYPLGATIDARGFTGNQVCVASNITTMLFKCVPQGSSTGATGGKLLLGDVNLYADGPLPPATSYLDLLGSGIGTPALIIPSEFWGIEGVSRGAGNAGTTNGTWLSVCTGLNTPVNNCKNPFPVRSFPVFAISVSGNTMTITLTGNVTSGTNIYQAELAMVKGSSTAGENGTYKIQSITNGTSTGSVRGLPPASTALAGAGANGRRSNRGLTRANSNSGHPYCVLIIMATLPYSSTGMARSGALLPVMKLPEAIE
jgi:hypothetical protein